MPYFSRIILNSFYNRLFTKLFQHNRRMPKYYSTHNNTIILLHLNTLTILGHSKWECTFPSSAHIISEHPHWWSLLSLVLQLGEKLWSFLVVLWVGTSLLCFLLPIMLCCSALKIHPLCSRTRIVIIPFCYSYCFSLIRP